MEHARSETPDSTAARRPESARAQAPQSQPPSVAGALALQRAVGNRAASRILARWAAHPDKDKKGVLLTDAAAAEFTRFNPPLSK